MSYREDAESHLKAALSFLEEKVSIQNVGYACLNLRMSIESLSYDRLSAYQDEVSFPTLETWQPGRILKELAEIDPEANQDRNISIQAEVEPGKWTTLISGPDNRFDVAWALKAYNTLGNFLHTPTIKQRRGNQGERAKIGSQRAGEIAKEISRVLKSDTWNTKIGTFARFDCECGAKIARRPEVLGSFSRVECAECRALFEVRRLGEDGYEIIRSRQKFMCPECSTENAFATEWVFTKLGIRCRVCKSEFDTMLTLHINPKKRPKEVG